MTIEEIFYSEDISVRSFNVCNDNDLKDLTAILKHYRENRTFDNLRNCGRKSNLELTALCLKYINYESNQIGGQLKPEKLLIANISNFTRAQREIVNSFIEINSNNLSNRSRNAISSFLDGNVRIKYITERILTNNRFSIHDLKNVGAKSVMELNGFISAIKEFIEKVSRIENENELIVLKNRFFIEKTFSMSTIPTEIIESQSIFKLVDFLLNEKPLNKLSVGHEESSIVDEDPLWLKRTSKSQSNLKSDKKNIISSKNFSLIFQKSLKIYSNQAQLTLDEIAEDINISKERVRQLRKICIEELFDKLEFVKIIDEDFFQKYGIDINQDFIRIDENLIEFINEINNTNFSNEFITYLIYVYLSDEFELIGNIEDVLQPRHFNSRNRHNWNNFYLVSNNISYVFNFTAFADDIEDRLNERTEQTYSFNFKSYLNNFVKVEGNYILPQIFPVAEKIINQEFDMIIDLYDNIVFKRNTIKQVAECVIEALEKLGMPSKVEDIYTLIEKDNPEITKSQDALRGTLQRTPEIIYFGRSSTYGLKKWEQEIEGIKGGTIKDIIIDFLKEKKQPMHISIILEHLKNFRGDKDERSVITNLKVDPYKRFIIYSQSFIGLKENIESYCAKYNKLPVHLGKTIIGKYQKGYTKSEIANYLQTNYDLTFDESNLIINNLKYFNEN